MNLLEILQKELKEFPEGMLYAVQDDDGEVKFGKHSQPKLSDSGIWQRHEDGNYLTIPRLELAEDWDSSIVTKDMWEKGRVKQMIVNVSGLSTEEKKQVNEALAKIMGAQVCNPTYWGKVSAMYVPSLDCVTVGFYYRTASQTHTPQQVLEMAGMTTNRKVRKDFDPTKQYSVDVSGCTEDEKEKVQQAFFDVGIGWEVGGKKYLRLDAEQYSNTTEDGQVTAFCKYGMTTKGCNMNHEEFFSYVYEPEQQGHVHAHLMSQYAEDAKITDKPWECVNNPLWSEDTEYRRKPKTHIVHGVEVPDLRIDPNEGEDYYVVDITEPELTRQYTSTNDRWDTMWAGWGLCYEPTEEGRQAAILHSKLMLGIA